MGLSQIMVFSASKQDVLDGSVKSAESFYPVSVWKVAKFAVSRSNTLRAKSLGNTEFGVQEFSTLAGTLVLD